MIQAGVHSSAKSCFHCGLEISDGFREYTLTLNGSQRHFCCPACRAVAESIDGSGLGQFYDYRDSKAADNAQSGLTLALPDKDYCAYDLEEVQIDFVTQMEQSPDLFEARLYIPNISCSACAWLIEHYLQNQFDGVKVTVNVSNHECRIVWRKSRFPLSEVFSHLARIGYQALPATENTFALARKSQNRSALLRLGVAGIGMMQVGMVSVALHAGDFHGIEDQWRSYLRWVNLIFALPILAYSAQPFFVSAIRVLRLRSVNMDVSVSIALLLAFLASVWATIFNTGEVYFDSLSMLVFFLLLGRYLEMRIRHKSADQSEGYSQTLPLTVELYIKDDIEIVPIKSVHVGDLIQVTAGGTIPCDGVVEGGNSHADESLLTGEFVPVEKRKGSTVLAGSINGPAALAVRVAAVGAETAIQKIQQLRDSAQGQRPKYQTLIAKVAVWFVLFVLTISLTTAIVWYFIDPSQTFWITLSVLVVTCPCALSLAAPAALTAGIQRLHRLGLLITSADFLETTPTVTHVVFDKTGTLTEGRLSVGQVKLIDSDQHISDDRVLQVIAALEAMTAHPIASAFKSIQYESSAVDVQVELGSGVSGKVDGVHYRFGKSQFACPRISMTYPGSGAWQLLAREGEPIAWIRLEDTIKPDALLMVKNLKARGLVVSVASGDRRVNVEAFCKQCGIDDYIAEAKPEDKLNFIQKLQQKGCSVLMIGDGINDVPVLAAADASIAMGNATHLTKTSADSILLNGKLNVICQCLTLAVLVQNKIKQNLIWAVLYNAIALPLAIVGYVPPYAAALGMSLSSIIVVANSLTLNRRSLK